MPIYKPYSSARLLKFCQDTPVVLEKKEGEEEREGRKQRRRIVAIKGADLYTRYLHKQVLVPSHDAGRANRPLPDRLLSLAG